MKTARTIDRERLPGELRTLIANVVDRDEADLPLSANLVDELGVDSVMRLEILVVLERTYGIKLAPNDLARIVSISDMCELVLETAARPAAAAAP